MGLDVYVGSLTRYYARAWETVIQRMARETGMALQMIRQNEPADAVTDPAAILEAVLAWRQGLANALAAHVPEGLSWDEGVDVPYATDKPAWDCYEGLVLWAAHDVCATPRLPAVVPSGQALEHPLVKAAREAPDADRYKQLLFGAEWWLPITRDMVFGAPSVAGTEVAMGSAPALHAQLGELNRRTWRASRAQVSKWRRDGAEHGAPLETSARMGFAVLYELASEAVGRRLPMLLDY